MHFVSSINTSMIKSSKRLKKCSISFNKNRYAKDIFAALVTHFPFTLVTFLQNQRSLLMHYSCKSFFYVYV